MTARSDQPLLTFIPVRDGARARAFYSGVLGLEVSEETPFAIVCRVPGGELRLAKTPDFSPQPFTVAGWQVGDITAEMAALAAKGVGFEVFDQMPQDAEGIWTTPDGARICWFRDPDGNLLSLTQPG